MNNLKRIFVSFTLMSVLAVTAIGGDMSCPPAETTTPPCVPGDINSPPCSTSSMTTSTTTEESGEVSDSLSINDIGTVAEAVAWALALL